MFIYCLYVIHQCLSVWIYGDVFLCCQDFKFKAEILCYLHIHIKAYEDQVSFPECLRGCVFACPLHPYKRGPCLVLGIVFELSQWWRWRAKLNDTSTHTCIQEAPLYLQGTRGIGWASQYPTPERPLPAGLLTAAPGPCSLGVWGGEHSHTWPTPQEPAVYHFDLNLAHWCLWGRSILLSLTFGVCFPCCFVVCLCVESWVGWEGSAIIFQPTGVLSNLWNLDSSYAIKGGGWGAF